MGRLLVSELPLYHCRIRLGLDSGSGRGNGEKSFLTPYWSGSTFVIMMIRWTGLAPREFEFPFAGSLTSTFLRGRGISGNEMLCHIRHGWCAQIETTTFSMPHNRHNLFEISITFARSDPAKVPNRSSQKVKSRSSQHSGLRRNDMARPKGLSVIVSV